MQNNIKIKVIGAGLAGSEAAWVIANAGFPVELYEMKPTKKSPAHNKNSFAELVCSNSLKADRLENASGLLKAEMRILGSLVLEAADATKVPAGGALAVDRDDFSEYITQKLTNHKNIKIISQEITSISSILENNNTDQETYIIIATGPLTSDDFACDIQKLLGESLYFYDAAAPIITSESLDFSKIFKASRYNRGDDYLNCPMSEEEYNIFYDALISAETVELKSFEQQKVFEGCMPVETMAKRGKQTLCYGPAKPVGLVDPKTNKEAFAVVQLRQENDAASLYNIVGFQTNLKFGEQKRVFGLIPGLQNADFARYGVMHRNTFIKSPNKLDNTYNLIQNKNIYFAGQITGVEGYVESASSGLVAGIALCQKLQNKKFDGFLPISAVGSLSNYVSKYSGSDFQPMNINFGVLPPIKPVSGRFRKKADKYNAVSDRALDYIECWADFNL